MLRDHGLADVFRSLAMTAPVRIIIDDDRTGRRSDAVEAAIYFCTLEAVLHA